MHSPEGGWWFDLGRSKQPVLGEGVDRFTDDEVIQHPHLDQLQRADQAPGQCLVVALAAVVLLVRLGGREITGVTHRMEIGRSLVYLLLAVCIWNYRGFWWDWLGL